MGTLASTATIGSLGELPLSTTTGLSTSLSISSSTLNDDGKVDKQKAKKTSTFLAIPAATITAELMLKHRGVERIKEEYNSSFIDSLSDEELAQTLEQLELLEVEKVDETINKTI